MNSFSALRGLCAVALVASPLLFVVACSQPASHPALIGDCTGPNCVAGGGSAGSSGSSGSGGDGSTTSDDSSTSTGDSGTGSDDSGSTGTGD